MTCHIIDVLAEGSKWTFQDPAHLCKWLREREENSANIYIYIYGECQGEGSRAVPRLPNSWPSSFSYSSHCTGGKGGSSPT